MSRSVLFSDDVHINTRNFGSLHQYLNAASLKFEVVPEGRNLWNRYGHYEDCGELRERTAQLSMLGEEDLRQLTATCCGTGLNIFDMAQAEILSRVLAEEETWFTRHIPRDRDFLFSKLYAENREILLENMAAALHWCDLYSRHLDPAGYAFAVIFSGSQIYQKILMNALRLTRTRTFLVETFQTGTEYYFEERYTPLANNSDARWPTVLNSCRLPAGFPERHREYIKAENKILMCRNKNVSQPKEPIPTEVDEFMSARDTVILACQVQNDFSLIENRHLDVNPLKIYERLISGLLERTDLNILIKTHPWERKKSNLKTSFTRDRLEEFVGNLESDAGDRVAIVEDINLHALFPKSSAFVTLNSQAAIEACYYGGLKPFTLGRPFYGGYGFTNDFSSVDDLVQALQSGSHERVLDLDAYERFRDWYTRMLQQHLVCVHASGLINLRSRLAEPQVISLAERKPCSSEPKTSLKESEQAGVVPVVPSRPSPEQVARIPANSNDLSPVKLAAIQAVDELTEDEIRRRKLRKLVRNPKAYLTDSRHRLLRMAGRII